MSEVQLVVTGRCEEFALHDSLGQLFPQLAWLRPIRIDSFTSSMVRGDNPPGLTATIDKFALKLIEKVDERSDCLVLGVDDLELDNEPAPVVSAVTAAIERGLSDPRVASSHSKRSRLEDQMRARCSFHLLVPLVEAYFFADPGALKRAGARRESRFDATTHDLESFSVVDQAFTGPPDIADKHDWRRGGSSRHKHPKRYLKFLTSDADGKWTYRESHHGARALARLDWNQTLAPPYFVTAARSLINDVSEFCGSPPREGVELVETSRATQRLSRLLRNL